MSEHTCTMLLAGRQATIDGSTIVCREEDYGNEFDPQRFVLVHPADHLEKLGQELVPVHALFSPDLPDVRQRDHVLRHLDIPVVHQTFCQASQMSLVLPCLHGKVCQAHRLPAAPAAEDRLQEILFLFLCVFRHVCADRSYLGRMSLFFHIFLLLVCHNSL